MLVKRPTIGALASASVLKLALNRLVRTRMRSWCGKGSGAIRLLSRCAPVRPVGMDWATMPWWLASSSRKNLNGKVHQSQEQN